jgi:hypothetical protein
MAISGAINCQTVSHLFLTPKIAKMVQFLGQNYQQILYEHEGHKIRSKHNLDTV